MFATEAPGQREDESRRPFSGLAGFELDNTYLRIAGLKRSDVYVTNVVHCRPPNNRKPSPHEIRECSSHFLPSEIRMVDPEFIVLMGASACSLVPELDLEAHHGIPQWAKIFQWEGWVFPTYHPAAGLHDTGFMTPLLEDFERLGELLRTDDPEGMIPEDLYPDPVYREVHSEELRRALEWHDVSGEQRLGIDQENQDGEMLSVQVSRVPGTGFLVRGDDWESLKVLRDGVASGRFVCLLHNSPQDMDWLEEKAGIYIPSWRLRDTMQESAQLGNLPQGLKPLAYRLCGMRMKSYDQVVDVPSRKAVLEWLEEAEEYVLPEVLEILPKPKKSVSLVPKPVRLKKDGTPYKTRRPKSASQTLSIDPNAATGGLAIGFSPPPPSKVRGIRYKALKHPLWGAVQRIKGHLLEDPELGAKRYDPWKAWESEKVKWATALKEAEDDDDTDAPAWVRGKAGEDKDRGVEAGEKAEKALVAIGEIEGRLGRMPSRGLRRVPWGEALRYSVSDADACLRVAAVMEKRAGLVGREIMEEDYK